MGVVFEGGDETDYCDFCCQKREGNGEFQAQVHYFLFYFEPIFIVLRLLSVTH